MAREIEITQEGYQKLQTDLKELVGVKRPQILARLQTAKEYGDLTENAEYESAKNDQSFIEGKIRELQTILKNARIVQKQNSSQATLGSDIVCQVEGKTETYKLVSSTEADPSSGKISTESPLGRELLGKAAGEKVNVVLPDGEKVSYRIIKIG